MIFSNTSLFPRSREDIPLGHAVTDSRNFYSYGPGRRKIHLSAPYGLRNIEAYEVYSELTLDYDFSTGVGLISRAKNGHGTISLILSSIGDTPGRIEGLIYAFSGNSNLSRALVKSSNYDRPLDLPHWSAALIRAHEGDVFRVSGSRSLGCEAPAVFYVVEGGFLRIFNEDKIEKAYAAFGTQPPFSFARKGDANTPVYLAKQWQLISETPRLLNKKSQAS